MNQFEELILEESSNICEQLSSSEVGGRSSFRGMSPTRNRKLIEPQREATKAVWAMLLIAAVFMISLFLISNYQGGDFSKGLADTSYNFEAIFLQPYTHSFSLGDVLYEIVIILGLAFFTTLSGAIIALFLGLLASGNMIPKHVVKIIKGLVVSIRIVPTIIWIAILAAVTGVGSVAVVVGMTLPSISYLTKAYADSCEDLGQSVIEALMVDGVSRTQIATGLLSCTFLRFEINFANVIALVAAVGAGGIRSNSMSTYFIIAFAILLEVGLVSRKIKFPVIRYRKS